MTDTREDELAEFVLVPRKPTQEMLAAEFAAYNETLGCEVRNVGECLWSAMIAAAPAYPVPDAVAKLVEALNTSRCPRPCVAGDNTVAGCIDAGVCNCGNRAALASFTRTTP